MLSNENISLCIWVFKIAQEKAFDSRIKLHGLLSTLLEALEFCYTNNVFSDNMFFICLEMT